MCLTIKIIYFYFVIYQKNAMHENVFAKNLRKGLQSKEDQDKGKFNTLEIYVNFCRILLSTYNIFGNLT